MKTLPLAPSGRCGRGWSLAPPAHVGPPVFLGTSKLRLGFFAHRLPTNLEGRKPGRIRSGQCSGYSINDSVSQGMKKKQLLPAGESITGRARRNQQGFERRSGHDTRHNTCRLCLPSGVESGRMGSQRSIVTTDECNARIVHIQHASLPCVFCGGAMFKPQRASNLPRGTWGWRPREHHTNLAQQW